MDQISKDETSSKTKCTNCNIHLKRKNCDTCVYCMFYRPPSKFVGIKKEITKKNNCNCIYCEADVPHPGSVSKKTTNILKCSCCGCGIRDKYTRHGYKCTYIN